MLSFDGSELAWTNVSPGQLNADKAPATGQVLAFDGNQFGWTNASQVSQSWLLTGSANTSPSNGNFIGTTDDQPLELHVNGTRALRLEPNFVAPNIIGGSPNNAVSDGAAGAFIGGGQNNNIQASDASIGGGQNNSIQAAGATIGGGQGNQASGLVAAIPGGQQNVASGAFSFAAGYQAQALHQGAFVWADSQGSPFASTANDQFLIRAQGGVRFTSGNGNTNQTVSWIPGGGSWSFSSDRNLKEAIVPVNPEAILEKISHLPVAEWRYKNYTQLHIGAMAQDFHALFPLNDNDKMLDDADLHGVEIAAIQGLNRKLEERDHQLREEEQHLEILLKERDVKIQALQNQLDQLQKAVARLPMKTP